MFTHFIVAIPIHLYSMKRIHFLFMLFIFLSQRANHGQAMLTATCRILPPPSPEASALGKYIEYPLRLFTGTADINIPLMEVKSGRITVPVNLSYQGSDYPLAFPSHPVKISYQFTRPTLNIQCSG